MEDIDFRRLYDHIATKLARWNSTSCETHFYTKKKINKAFRRIIYVLVQIVNDRNVKKHISCY